MMILLGYLTCGLYNDHHLTKHNSADHNYGLNDDGGDAYANAGFLLLIKLMQLVKAHPATSIPCFNLRYYLNMTAELRLAKIDL